MANERIDEPGELATTTVGRVFIIYYPVATTLEREQKIAAAYLEHSRAHAGRGVILAVYDAPMLPLPPLELRAHWREFLRASPSIDAVALVSGGLVGLAGAAVINLLEPVMDPAFGVPFRAFTDSSSAIAWLESTAELGTDEPALREQINSLRASA